MRWRALKERMWEKFDRRLTQWEYRGFRGANRLHRYAVNGILLYMGYLVYDFLVSYNDLLLHVRSTNKYEEHELEGPINKEDD
jgi:hypothetical protein